ncbi:MAG: c-type cytochrome [Gemmatimonadota bacterium]
MQRVLAAALTLLVLVAAPAAAQIPDEFTNLQVLPEDISRRSLIATMRGFAGGLGVRCTHCHVGENAATLEGFDFASDEKETKQVARVMLRMVQDINQRHLPETGREDRLRVTCVTCHRRLTKPQSLRDKLADVFSEEGIEAATAAYTELRAEHFGDGSYNFSPSTLASLAERLVGQGEIEAALAFLDLNIELYPDNVFSFWVQYQARTEQGQHAEAVKSLERALELEPGSEFFQQALAEAEQRAESAGTP